MKFFKSPLKKLTLGIYDGPHATPNDTNSGHIFLGIKNITPQGRLDFSEVNYISDQEFPQWTKRVIPKKDDIVFTYEATLHRYAIIPDRFDGCLGRRVGLLRPDTSKVIPRFLHYYFISPTWRHYTETKIIVGATVNRLPVKDFPDFIVSIPESLKVQQKIADILSAYDDLIENNRRRIQLLEESARMLYKEWFVRLRFPGHEHVKVVDGVPKGWERKTLGEVAPFNYGKSLTAENRIGGNIPVYASSGIVGTHNKPLVKGNGIIIGRKGNIGSIYWVTKDYFPIDTVYYIKPDDANLYLYYVLKNISFINTDVAVPGLNRDYAHRKIILIPDNKLYTRFVESVHILHNQIETLYIYNDKLAQARDLLLPKLMSGEVSV